MVTHLRLFIVVKNHKCGDVISHHLLHTGVIFSLFLLFTVVAAVLFLDEFFCMCASLVT